MKRPPFLLLILLATAGVGVARAQVSRDLAALRLAQLNLSAIITVQRWAEVAYDLVPPPGRGCPPSVSEPVFHPDGSTSQAFVNEDCSRGTVTTFRDGSFRTEITHVNGLRETIRGVVTNVVSQPG